MRNPLTTVLLNVTALLLSCFGSQAYASAEVATVSYFRQCVALSFLEKDGGIHLKNQCASPVTVKYCWTDASGGDTWTTGDTQNTCKIAGIRTAALKKGEETIVLAGSKYPEGHGYAAGFFGAACPAVGKRCRLAPDLESAYGTKEYLMDKTKAATGATAPVQSANTAPLSQMAAPSASAQKTKVNPQTAGATHANGKDNNDLINTTDGFEFRLVPADNDPTRPIIEALGGPCRTVGIEGIHKPLNFALNSALKPDFRNNYYFEAWFWNKDSNRGDKGYFILSSTTGLSQTIQANRDAYRSYVAQRRSQREIDSVKETYEQAECLEMNRMQYVIALENWVRTNEKQLTKINNTRWSPQ